MKGINWAGWILSIVGTLVTTAVLGVGTTVTCHHVRLARLDTQQAETQRRFGEIRDQLTRLEANIQRLLERGK